MIGAPAAASRFGTVAVCEPAPSAPKLTGLPDALSASKLLIPVAVRRNAADVTEPGLPI